MNQDHREPVAVSTHEIKTAHSIIYRVTVTSVCTESRLNDSIRDTVSSLCSHVAKDTESVSAAIPPDYRAASFS